MLPVKGSRIWIKLVCLSPAEPLMNTASFHPCSTSAIKPLCQERVHIIPRSLGWIKWGSEEQLTHKGQGGPARRKPVLLKAPEPLRGISLHSHLAKAGEYLRLLFSSVDQLSDLILRCWLPLVFLTPVEGGEVGQTPPPCEPGRTSVLSTSAMEGTLSITSSGNCGLSLDITSSG